MSDYGIVTESGAVRFERRLDAPIESVWAHLTVPSLRAKWFAAGEVDLRPGGAIILTFEHSKLTQVDDEAPPENYEGYRFEGRVLQVDEPRLLVHSWTEEDGSETEVTYELEPFGEQTLLVLTHRRIFDMAMMRDVAAGWHAHLALLSDLLGDRPVRSFWPLHSSLKAEYDQRLG